MAVRALLAALTVALAAACAAPAADGDDAESSEDAITQDLRPELAQVVDVSIMFPLAKTKAAFDRGYLAPGNLLPKTVYERAFGPPGTLSCAGARPAIAASARSVRIRR